MLTSDQANCICMLIHALEQRQPYPQVLAQLHQDGWTSVEINEATAALGKLAGMDPPWEAES